MAAATRIWRFQSLFLNLKKHLEENGIAIESKVRWERGGQSLYFGDPDGNLLELATPGLSGDLLIELLVEKILAADLVECSEAVGPACDDFFRSFASLQFLDGI